ncbi:MAG TPA: hypothetical protein VN238_01390 [Solirubrobacteraceae bacterium]|nr:hypothetical protein [Solirubrobacteraceae bacterium]
MRVERTPEDRAELPAEDAMEHGVLHHVLAHHPAPLHRDDLSRAFDEPEMAVTEAVDGLRRDGLLHWHGEFVVASRAAIRFDELGR